MIQTLRRCSNVRRCHTFPHHGEYTVGKHSYDAVMLLLTLNPHASAELIKAVLMHDLGEFWVGDMPCTAHWKNKELGVAYRAAERAALDEARIKIPDLNLSEQAWLAAVDKLELLYWTMEQIDLGNEYARVVFQRLVDYFKENINSLPEPIVFHMRKENLL